MFDLNFSLDKVEQMLTLAHEYLNVFDDMFLLVRNQHVHVRLQTTCPNYKKTLILRRLWFWNAGFMDGERPVIQYVLVLRSLVRKVTSKDDNLHCHLLG